MPVPIQPFNIPLSRMFVCLRSVAIGNFCFTMNVISAMFGTMICPTKKLENNSPTSVSGELSSPKTGPISRMLVARRKDPVTRMTRISTHFGTMLEVPIMYEDDIAAKIILWWIWFRL